MTTLDLNDDTTRACCGSPDNFDWHRLAQSETVASALACVFLKEDANVFSMFWTPCVERHGAFPV